MRSAAIVLPPVDLAVERLLSFYPVVRTKESDRVAVGEAGPSDLDRELIGVQYVTLRIGVCASAQ
jgi:hypothetical protein